MPGEVLFPHICTKNCKVAVNFGEGAADKWLSLDELSTEGRAEAVSQQMIFAADLERDRLLRGPVPPSSKGECTVRYN